MIEHQIMMNDLISPTTLLISSSFPENGFGRHCQVVRKQTEMDSPLFMVKDVFRDLKIFN